MKLSREQMLTEMGIAPLWRLRVAETESVPEKQAEAAPIAPDPGKEAADHPSPRETVDPPAPSRAEHIARLDWDELARSASLCRACVLCEQRKQAVFGVGDIHADWLFIGEGPGAEEDAKGEPFVGQAGKLLDNMLAAIDLKRGDKVYIANTVKCRPPGNRNPTVEEMAACRPYLERQIDLLQPRLIVLLGKAAAVSVLKNDNALGSLRGKRFEYRGIPVVVTYHPAYLLRSLPEKAKAWEDLVFARRLLREAGNGASAGRF